MRLLRLTLLLIVFTSCTVFASCYIGTTQPPTVNVVFTNPDGSPCQMPCLFGIRPNITRLEDLLQIEATHPYIKDFKRSALGGIYQLSNENHEIEIVLDENNLVQTVL